MKSLILLPALLCFVMTTAFAPIDESIPMPNDLKIDDVEILSKRKLADGTIEIKYHGRNGNRYTPTISPAKKGEVPIVKEWLKDLKEQKPIDPGTMTIKATGTGRTIGNIANISVTNNNDIPVDILPQTLFIPSDGKYQSYVGHIPDGITIPPGATSNIPVDGVCTDVHTPPVPPGAEMPPLEEWIPVYHPGDIIDGSAFPIISTPPVPSFDPESIPAIMDSPGYTAVAPDPEADIIITWPGTDIPVGGTIDPGEDPAIFAPVIVMVVEAIESASEAITESGIVTTPFASDPPKQEQSLIQHMVWIFASIVTGDPYEKPDFTAKVYEQYEDNSGNEVITLPQENKEKLDSGIDDFWNAFTAVGVEAKVISDKSPGLDLDPTVLATVTSPACVCNNISYDLEVKRAGVGVHTGSHTTPKSPKITIDDFAYGDSLEVKITNIKANCNCDDAECLFYPAQSTKSGSPGYTKTDLTKPGKAGIEISNDGANVASENHNATLHDPMFNEDGTAYSFGLKIKDENSLEKSAFQRLQIKAYCELPDCRRALCKKTIQLNFVTAN